MKMLKTLVAASIAAASVPALAYEAGDIIVKAGVVNVAPKSDNLKLDGVGTVEVKDDTQLGLTLTYMVAPQVGVEVLAATPFKHDIELEGDKIGDTQHLPPTVSAQYYPMSPASKFQPYVGLGVNHTFFFDESDSINHLGKSWGLAFSAGMNYEIADSFMANVGIWKMDIDSELDGSGNDVEIDPLVVMIGGGMKF
ncbi:outer membrane protein W [Bacterioplanes sanyensis]|uniref:OmpW/AlkL family protein n=1 Tax=Bacterioplanes sanyensis TaxID=1249553 RepID=UPI0019AF098A|nr:OmpW family outer membrane protein [Bacterioplanes sanyensis]GGY34069.1 outer membrane protein W [Bacterioplanes sanyensis]